MKNENHRGSTKISMNFKNKTHGTSETNKSFNHCDLEWGIKTKHTVCRRLKNVLQIFLVFQRERYIRFHLWIFP